MQPKTRKERILALGAIAHEAGCNVYHNPGVCVAISNPHTRDYIVLYERRDHSPDRTWWSEHAALRPRINIVLPGGSPEKAYAVTLQQARRLALEGMGR